MRTKVFNMSVKAVNIMFTDGRTVCKISRAQKVFGDWYLNLDGKKLSKINDIALLNKIDKAMCNNDTLEVLI